MVEPPAPRRKAIFTTVSVVLIASAAARPPAREASATAASTPGRSLSMGRRSPIRPGGAAAISPAPSAGGGGQVLGGGVRVLEAKRAGAGIGPAGVEHHGPDPATPHDLAGPDHRSGLHPVGGEYGGGGP